MTKDWQQWHDHYDRNDTSLIQRLEAVQAHLHNALQLASEGGASINMTTVCAGDGRDVLPVLAEFGDAAVTAVLVELDPVLADRARSRAAELGLTNVTVRTADAGAIETYLDIPAANVLTVCGVFGNISTGDVHKTITMLPGLLAPGGLVIWTRGVQDADRTPAIREDFASHGFTEISFTSTSTGVFRVGTHQLTAPAAAGQSSPRMFTFA